MNDEITVTQIEATTGQLSIYQPLKPLGPPAAMRDLMRQYTDVNNAILDDSDKQMIPGGKWFVKKSGWLKRAVAYGISTQKVEREIFRDENGQIMRAEFVMRAIAPNGRFADGWGACAADETRFRDSRARQKLEHDIPATAQTRATNRAISNLVGNGEVSAEEVDGDPQSSPSSQPARQVTQQSQPREATGPRSGDNQGKAEVWKLAQQLAKLRKDRDPNDTEGPNQVINRGIVDSGIERNWTTIATGDLSLLTQWLRTHIAALLDTTESGAETPVDQVPEPTIIDDSDRLSF